jgi:UDP:flavonoid glycosyltransferase YjiC (YdhE family)
MIIIPAPAHTEKMDNARSIKKLGLGLVVSQQRLSKNVLLKAINKILATPSFKRKATAVKNHARKYNAIQTIIEYIFSITEQDRGIN